jgi:hypothetical protein
LATLLGAYTVDGIRFRTNWLARHHLIVRLALVLLWAGLPGVGGPAPSRAVAQDGLGEAVVETLQQVGGLSRTLAVRGSYVYLGVGPRVVVLDAADAANVVPVGQSPVLPGVVWTLGLDTSGSFVYVAPQWGEVYILDVSNPRVPTWLSTFTFDSAPGPSQAGPPVSRIVEREGLLYLAAGTNGLRVVDVHDPERPVELGCYCEGQSVLTVQVVEGGVAYVQCYCDGWVNTFRILDVAEPSAISVRGDYERPLVPGIVSGKRLIASVPFQTVMDIIDITEPDEPREIASVALPDYEGPIAVVGEYVYFLSNALYVMELANPMHFEVVRSLGGLGALTLAPGGTRLYALRGDGMQVIDVSEPTRPREGGRYPLLPSAISVKVDGDRAFATGANFGMEVYDLARSAGPSKLGQAERVTRVVAVANSYVIAAGGGLSLVDVSDPARPAIVGSFDGSVFAAGVAWPYIYAGDAFGGLTVLNASTPTQLVPVGFAPAQSGPARAAFNNVAVAGSYAYVAASSGHLRVINVADAMNPVEVGSFDLGVDGWGLAVDGSRVYVADGHAGLRIFDASDPTDPVEIGSYDTPGDARSVVVQSGIAYVADGRSGLHVIDVSEPTRPMEIISYPLIGAAEDVALHGDEVVVAAREAGLWLLRLETP